MSESNLKIDCFGNFVHIKHKHPLLQYWVTGNLPFYTTVCFSEMTLGLLLFTPQKTYIFAVYMILYYKAPKNTVFSHPVLELMQRADIAG